MLRFTRPALVWLWVGLTWIGLPATRANAQPAVDAAPFALAEAYVRLEMAFSAPDAVAALDAAWDLAARAQELSDPFLSSARDAGGAGRPSPAVSGSAPNSSDSIDPVAAALSLRRESGAARAAIEAAVARGDATTADQLRIGRVDAARSVARSLIQQAWHRAGSPDLGVEVAAGSRPGVEVLRVTAADKVLATRELPAR